MPRQARHDKNRRERLWRGRGAELARRGSPQTAPQPVRSTHRAAGRRAHVGEVFAQLGHIAMGVERIGLDYARVIHLDAPRHAIAKQIRSARDPVEREPSEHADLRDRANGAHVAKTARQLRGRRRLRQSIGTRTRGERFVGRHLELDADRAVGNNGVRPESFGSELDFAAVHVDAFDQLAQRDVFEAGVGF